MPSETTTACVRLLVFFRIRRSTFPHGVENDASTISQTPTTHYTSTRVKLTIVTHLSFSERIAIANLSFIINGTLARSLEPVVTECKDHNIHTQTQVVASRKPKEIKRTHEGEANFTT